MFASAAQDLLILGVLCLHVWLTPYTKVEESFNLHATHDIILRGLSPSALKSFDHFTFPGPVPRSFLGSLLLGLSAKIAIAIANHLGICFSKPDIQLLVRLLLATSNGVGLCYLRRVTSRRFGRLASWLFAFFTISQYHLPFWAGRTLPNMFALSPSTIAYGQLSVALCDRKKTENRDTAIGLLVFCAVVLRAEIAFLLGPICFQLLLNGTYTISRLLIVGVRWCIISLVITVCIDSYFWDSWPLWPELNGVIFNVIQGKSSEWGTSPPSTYFSVFLPKLLLATSPLTLLGIALDGRVRRFILPCVLFTIILSGLGHKEWRFIVYTIPIMNIAAAQGACRMIRLSPRRTWRFVASAIVAGVVAVNLLASMAFTVASTLNYPGGQALSSLQLGSLSRHGNSTIFIDDLAAQTGASLFLQTGSSPFVPCGYNSSQHTQPWVYHKILNHSTVYTHAIVEDVSGYLPPSVLQSSNLNHTPFTFSTRLLQPIQLDERVGFWTPVGIVRGLDGWGFDSSSRSWLARRIPVPFVKPKLWILEREN